MTTRGAFPDFIFFPQFREKLDIVRSFAPYEGHAPETVLRQIIIESRSAKSGSQKVRVESLMEQWVTGERTHDDSTISNLPLALSVPAHIVLLPTI